MVGSEEVVLTKRLTLLCLLCLNLIILSPTTCCSVCWLRVFPVGGFEPVPGPATHPAEEKWRLEAAEVEEPSSEMAASDWYWGCIVLGSMRPLSVDKDSDGGLLVRLRIVLTGFCLPWGGGGGEGDS